MSPIARQRVCLPAVVWLQPIPSPDVRPMCARALGLFVCAGRDVRRQGKPSATRQAHNDGIRTKQWSANVQTCLFVLSRTENCPHFQIDIIVQQPCTMNQKKTLKDFSWDLHNQPAVYSVNFNALLRRSTRLEGNNKIYTGGCVWIKQLAGGVVVVCQVSASFVDIAKG